MRAGREVVPSKSPRQSSPVPSKSPRQIGPRSGRRRVGATVTMCHGPGPTFNAGPWSLDTRGAWAPLRACSGCSAPRTSRRARRRQPTAACEIVPPTRSAPRARQYHGKRWRRAAMAQGEGEAPAQNNVVMSAGKRSCPDIICYLLSVICYLARARGPKRISARRVGRRHVYGTHTHTNAYQRMPRRTFQVFGGATVDAVTHVLHHGRVVLVRVGRVDVGHDQHRDQPETPRERWRERAARVVDHAMQALRSTPFSTEIAYVTDTTAQPPCPA